MGRISNLLRTRVARRYFIINHCLDRIAAVFPSDDGWSHYRSPVWRWLLSTPAHLRCVPTALWLDDDQSCHEILATDSLPGRVHRTRSRLPFRALRRNPATVLPPKERPGQRHSCQRQQYRWCDLPNHVRSVAEEGRCCLGHASTWVRLLRHNLHFY